MRNKGSWVTAGLVMGLLTLPGRACFAAEDRALFDKKCANCHGKDGQASAGLAMETP